MKVMIGEQLRVIITRPSDAFCSAKLEVARLMPQTIETSDHLRRSSHEPKRRSWRKAERTTAPKNICRIVIVTERLKACTTYLLTSDMATEHNMQKRHERATTVARESCLPWPRRKRLRGST